MKYYATSKAVCPFYKHESSSMICCQGFTDGLTLHMAWANKTDAMEYKHTYCRTECYHDCRVCRMLEDEEIT